MPGRLFEQLSAQGGEPRRITPVGHTEHGGRRLGVALLLDDGHCTRGHESGLHGPFRRIDRTLRLFRGFGQVACGVLVRPGIAGGDPIPGEILTHQPATTGTHVGDAVEGGRTDDGLLGTAEDDATDQGVHARPGRQGRLDRVERQHGDPPAPDPTLDRQQVGARFAQRDGRRTRIRAKHRDVDRLLARRDDRRRSLVDPTETRVDRRHLFEVVSGEGMT